MSGQQWCEFIPLFTYLISAIADPTKTGLRLAYADVAIHANLYVRSLT